MEYDDLLSNAYKNVQQTENCGRFEVLKVEGHNEGSKTIIKNFLQIASCIRRKPEHLAKFLLKELASSGDITGERLVLSRKVSSKDINDKIQKFADCYVKCENCGKPDTQINEEGEKQFIRCLACGHKKQIPNKF
jgi:translation initiation factor 2 subunit 2